MKEKIKNLFTRNINLRQTIFKNTFWLGFGTALSKIIRAVTVIYAARILGVSGYGIFSYALGVATFFTIFSDIGLSPLFVRELSAVKSEKERGRLESNNYEQREYFSNIFLLKIILLLITILMVVFIAPLFTTINEARALLPIAALLLAADSLRGFMVSFSRSENRMEIEALITILTEVFITGLSLFVLFKFPSDKNLLIAYSTGSAIGMLISVWIFREQLKKYLVKLRGFNHKILMRIFSFSWPFAILGLFSPFMLNIDIIIVSWFRPVSDLGFYAAAQKPILLLYGIPGFLATSVFPIIVNLIKKNESQKLKVLLEKSIQATMVIAIPMLIGGIILAEEIIILLFGNQYIGATLAFQLLLFTFIFVFPGSIIENVIFAFNQQRIFLISIIGGSLINVVFDLLLIPPYGIAGSAVATILSLLFSKGYSYYRFKKIINFQILNQLNKIIFASLVMGITTLILASLNINVLVNIGISGLVYAAVLFLLKEPLLKEFKSIFQMS
jgi:O-antigen/teichoic acid export membrane protein